MPYQFYRCGSCGEEFLDMGQLHDVAERYRKLKRYTAKLSRWGQSTGLRIPKELIERYRFCDEVTLVPQAKGILVVKAG